MRCDRERAAADERVIGAPVGLSGIAVPGGNDSPGEWGLAGDLHGWDRRSGECEAGRIWGTGINTAGGSRVEVGSGRDVVPSAGEPRSFARNTLEDDDLTCLLLKRTECERRYRGLRPANESNCPAAICAWPGSEEIFWTCATAESASAARPARRRACAKRSTFTSLASTFTACIS